ncbi:hypothetical protein [Clostridium sp. AWRP]|uniref:hypothetical protein n=1 Tax=Clostridium sp. AWRP TaxID=2212991 RepID=UPI000FDB2E70|nr:hypothetical protein [Clostridium sp. AWRP]AZV57628.1 hypothetical protein DMR38_13910 [Clostridium sp. AWRP]
MIKNNLKIENIPAILWGKKSDKLFVAIHGNMSNKEDDAITIISTPIGQTLYWDYYCYVKEHPISAWNKPTSILYGSEDNLCEFNVIASFVKRFNCNLQVMEQGEHYFHTEEQLQFLRQWIKKYI